MHGQLSLAELALEELLATKTEQEVRLVWTHSQDRIKGIGQRQTFGHRFKLGCK